MTELEVRQESSMTRLPTKKAVLDGGLEFHFIEQGTGVPLIFIHGGSGDYSSWGGQWDAFAPHFRTISYSRRFSRPNRNDPASSPNHSALVDAQDLERLLAHWDAERAVLVGSSYGALTALALAVRAPKLVRAMILTEPPLLAWADMTPGGKELREQFEQDVRLAARAAFARGDDLEGATIFANGVLGVSGLKNLSDDARARRFGNVLAMKVLALSDQGFPTLSLETVRTLAMPILLLSGENTQPILAACFTALCSALPSAEVHRVSGSGHSVYREKPEVHSALAKDFLRRHSLMEAASSGEREPGSAQTLK